jgi:hypothetical protein
VHVPAAIGCVEGLKHSSGVTIRVTEEVRYGFWKFGLPATLTFVVGLEEEFCRVGHVGWNDEVVELSSFVDPPFRQVSKCDGLGTRKIYGKPSVVQGHRL